MNSSSFEEDDEIFGDDFEIVPVTADKGGSKNITLVFRMNMPSKYDENELYGDRYDFAPSVAGKGGKGGKGVKKDKGKVTLHTGKGTRAILGIVKPSPAKPHSGKPKKK